MSHLHTKEKMPSRRRVALIIESMATPRRAMLNGVARYTQEHGQWMIYLKPSSVDRSIQRWLEQWEGDGIITTVMEKGLAILKEFKVPVVDMLGEFGDGSFPVVRTDDRAVGRMGADHLIDCGFRNYGFCEYENRFWSVNRRIGFEDKVRSAGYDCHIYTMQKPGPASGGPERWEQQQNDIAKWIKTLPKPIGIMTTNDLVGQQLLEACQRLQIDVPDTVAVVGVDNDEPICRIASPQLSSVILDDERRGYEAAATLARMMSGDRKPHEPVLVPPIGVATRLSTDVFANEDHVFVRALKFLRENAFGRIGVDEIATAVDVSRSVLERRFRHILGRSVNSEIIRIRLNQAIQLLAETKLDMRFVAARCGFNTQAYMTTVFKRKLGRTPGSYRSGRAAHPHLAIPPASKDAANNRPRYI